MNQFYERASPPIFPDPDLFSAANAIDDLAIVRAVIALIHVEEDGFCIGRKGSPYLPLCHPAVKPNVLRVRIWPLAHRSWPSLCAARNSAGLVVMIVIAPTLTK